MWLKSSSREESNRKRRKRRKTGLLSSWQRPQRPLGEQKITRKRAERSRTVKRKLRRPKSTKSIKTADICRMHSNALSVACIACHRRKHITDHHRLRRGDFSVHKQCMSETFSIKEHHGINMELLIYLIYTRDI